MNKSILVRTSIVLALLFGRDAFSKEEALPVAKLRQILNWALTRGGRDETVPPNERPSGSKGNNGDGKGNSDDGKRGSGAKLVLEQRAIASTQVGSDLALDKRVISILPTADGRIFLASENEIFVLGKDDKLKSMYQVGRQEHGKSNQRISALVASSKHVENHILYVALLSDQAEDPALHEFAVRGNTLKNLGQTVDRGEFASAVRFHESLHVPRCLSGKSCLHIDRNAEGHFVLEAEVDGPKPGNRDIFEYAADILNDARWSADGRSIYLLKYKMEGGS